MPAEAAPRFRALADLGGGRIVAPVVVSDGPALRARGVARNRTSAGERL